MKRFIIFILGSFIALTAVKAQSRLEWFLIPDSWFLICDADSTFVIAFGHWVVEDHVVIL